MAKIKEVVSKKMPKNTWAEADEQTGIIYIDPKCKGRKRLEMLNHEGMHILCPWMDEDAVRIIGAELTRIQWEQGYRLIDANESDLLQDEEHDLQGSGYILDRPDAEPILSNVKLDIEPS